MNPDPSLCAFEGIYKFSSIDHVNQYNTIVDCISYVFREKSIILNYRVGQYLVDIYFPDTGIVVECYGDLMANKRYSPKVQAERELVIEQHLGVDSIRFAIDDVSLAEIIRQICDLMSGSLSLPSRKPQKDHGFDPNTHDIIRDNILSAFPELSGELICGYKVVCGEKSNIVDYYLMHQNIVIDKIQSTKKNRMYEIEEIVKKRKRGRSKVIWYNQSDAYDMLSLQIVRCIHDILSG